MAGCAGISKCLPNFEIQKILNHLRVSYFPVKFIIFNHKGTDICSLQGHDDTGHENLKINAGYVLASPQELPYAFLEVRMMRNRTQSPVEGHLFSTRFIED